MGNDSHLQKGKFGDKRKIKKTVDIFERAISKTREQKSIKGCEIEVDRDNCQVEYKQPLLLILKTN